MEEQTVDNLIERIATLRKSELRRGAALEKLQLVHADILDYLSRCNRYSNTMLAVSEYLGQTKGTVSQSLQLLEKKGLIARQTDKNDRRITRLSLTAAGKKTVERLHKCMPSAASADPVLENALRKLLSAWQSGRNHASFGLCHSCQHNQKPGDDSDHFRCGLTGEGLKREETLKICREHKHAA